MSMPRYLYSINDSMQAPLLPDNKSTNDKEVELAISAKYSPIPEETSDKFETEETSDKFEQDVVLQLPTAASESRKTYMYASARLAASGAIVPNEDDEDSLLGADHRYTLNGEDDMGATQRRYGTNNSGMSIMVTRSSTRLLSEGVCKCVDMRVC